MVVLSLLLAVIASDPAPTVERPDAIWVELPHGSFPKITKYEVQGKLPKSNDVVAASFRVRERAWEVTIGREGRSSVRLQVSSNGRGSAHFERALLWASGDERELRLMVPYGEPQHECFANGNEVFESVYVIIPREGAPEVHESRFENCENQTERLVTTEENGWLVVAD